MEELKKAIFDMPREKAPGPDDFIGLFFRSCWDTISEDLMASITQLVERGDGGAPLLNSANIVLIPKKTDAEMVGGFRPIIHSVSKLLSKMMASHVAPLLNELVSASQSAFIKKRCITTISSMCKALSGILTGTRRQVFSSSWTSQRHSIPLIGRTSWSC